VTEPKGTLANVAEHLALAVQPLRGAVADIDSFRAFLFRFGWEAESIPSSYVDLGGLAAEALAAVEALGDGAAGDEIAAALDKIRALYVAVQGLDEAPAGVEAGEFLGEFAERLFEILLVDYLAAAIPTAYNVLRLLHVIQLEDHEATPTRPAFVRTRFAFDEIPRVVTEPGSLPARVYGWGTPDFDFPLLANHALDLLHALGVLASLASVAPDLSEALQTSPEQTDAAISIMVHVPLFELDVADTTIEGGLALLELPGENGHLPGLILQPLVPSEVGTQLDLGGGLALRVRAGTDLASTFGVVVRPGDIDVRYPFQPETEFPSAGFGVALVFTPEAPKLLLGEPAGTRLQVAGTSVGFEVETEAGQLELRASFHLVDLVLVLSAGDQDGFLAQLLGGDLTVPLPLAIDWSSRTGLTFSGSTGFAVATYPHLSVGLVRIDELALAVRSPLDAGQPPELSVAASLGLSGSLGPIAFTLNDIGLRLRLRFADGNTGPFDLAVGFKPPAGLGLAVDAGPVSGGGFLGHDPATGRYFGVLDLRAGQIDITALGLLDTKLPAGQGGYALLLVLHATFPALQVGFGFALTGVGGLLALNRRVNVDALRGRLAAGTAGRILAPQDPIRNAPALLADLDAVFPPAPGITVVGPTVQLLWAGLVHLDVGVFIELPGPARVVLLGSAHAELERDGRALLSVRVDIVGVVDLRAATAAFDAVLIDSHLLGMLDLTGGAAFRLSLGTQPYALLTLGGFHPAYHPEPLAFPSTLTRIAMVHGTPSDELYLRFEGYFAITSNSLQFGASVEALIQSGGFIVHGNLGFDALIRRDPFHFQIDLRASVSVAYEGHTLAGLTLTGSLTGPGPTVLHAKVCIELLFFDICFSGTFPLGPVVELLTAAADLLAALLGELDNPATLRPAGAPDPHVRLRPPAPSLTTPLVAPTGTLVWEQQRAPLDLLLTRVGGTPLPAPTQVSATSAASSTAANDWFAPGQFLDLSDDQALTRPAYELLAGGLRLVGTGVVDGPSAQRPLTISQIRLPAKATTPNKEVRMFPAWIVASPARPATPLIAVATERWIVTTPTGERRDLTGAQARQLATLTTAARAVPETDRLAALTF
jgi:Family of unknown function (DUF6603)